MCQFARPAVFAALFLLTACTQAGGGSNSRGEFPPDSPEAREFGYPSPAAALAALRKRPGVRIYQEQGWTMVVDEANFTLWTFTPPDHPAHPSGVKRAAVEEDGAIYIRMSAKCEASKTECDKHTAEFVALNEQVRRDLEAGNLSAF